MADGRIVIKVDVADKQLDQLNTKLDKTSNTAKSFTVAMLATKAITAVFSAISGSLDQAISRFDTMNQYPRMMELIGVSSASSERSIRKLSDGIQGLPTRLDEVVATSQNLTVMTGNINKATDLTLALNNAFLASGSSGADASRGLLQYTQMLANGKPDMQSWKTLQETMPVGLQKTAEAFGFAGTSAKQDFYQALKSGKITFDQFGDKLIELNRAVGGFAEMALEGSKGIATSWQNIKTAMVNGTTKILESLDNVSKGLTGNNIASNLDSLKSIVLKAFTAMADGINDLMPLWQFLYDAVKKIIHILIALTPQIEGAAIALLSFKILNNVKDWFELAGSSAISFGKNVVNAIGSLTSPLGLLSATIGLVAGIAITQTKKMKKAVEDAMKPIRDETSKTGDAIQELADTVDESSENYKFNAQAVDENTDSLKDMSRNVFDLAGKTKRTQAETNELKDSIEQLNNVLGAGTVQYNEQTGAINLTQGAVDALIELKGKEAKLEAGRERAVELSKQISEAKYQEGEAQKAVDEINAQIAQMTIDRDNEVESVRKKNSFAMTSREAQAMDKMLEDMETEKARREENLEHATSTIDSLTAAEKAHTEEYKGLLSEQAEAEAQSAAAQAEMAENRKVVLGDLTEYEQQMLGEAKTTYQGLYKTVTDAFSKINTDSKISLDEMLENLTFNAQAVQEWASNLDSLSNSGINEGFLQYLRDAGPESAGLTAEIVEAIQADPSTIDTINSTWQEAANSVPDSFEKAFGITEEQVGTDIMDLITTMDGSMTEAFAANDWSKYGQDIGDGLAQGIDGAAVKAKGSSTDMANKVSDGFTSVLGIQSPSTKFKAHGTDIVTGLTNGITQSSSKAISAVKTMATEIENAVKPSLKGITTATSTELTSMQTTVQSKTAQIKTTMSSFLTSINTTTKTKLSALYTSTTASINQIKTAYTNGFESIRATVQAKMNSTVSAARTGAIQVGNAMQSGISAATNAGYYTGMGFANGLNSTRGRVMSVASSIANAASSTISRALQERSPSRVTFASGVNAGKGLALGMEDQVSEVKKMAALLANSAVPEVLASNYGGLSGTTNDKTTTNNNTPTVNFYGGVTWHGTEDIEKTMEEIGFITGQQNWRLA